MDRPTLFTQVGLVHLSTLIFLSFSLSTLFLRSPSLFFLFSFFDDDDDDDLPPIN
jgi:hypothetical protein